MALIVKNDMDRHGIVWDPSHSSRLYVVSPKSSETSLSLFQFYADVGVAEGSDHEFSTLLRLISDYERNLEKSSSSIRLQSQQYRESIHDCLGEFDKKNAERHLLSQIHSIFRLAEIFVLPATSFWAENNHSDWLDCPGIATADTVRFLRQFLLPNLMEGLEEQYIEDDMIDDEQQPIYKYPTDTKDKDSYWSLVLSLVRRGCLDMVWDLLKTHSLYEAALDGIHLSVMSEEDRALSQSLLQEWEQIGSVLLTAPLPGGRSMKWEDGASSNHTDDVSSQDIDLTYVHGLDVSYSDFRCWDIPSEDPEDGKAIVYKGDYPILFTPELALRKYKLWHDYALHVRRTNRLCRQISQMDQMFQLLCGDWTTTKKPLSSFTSWSEQLCAELLYRTPELRPRWIASRTIKLMKEFQEDNDESSNPIVSIMQGNAGRAMTELYELGGRSGAALPTTLMFLMFNLFVKADVIPDESVGKELDFLIDAAHSIVSSLHASHPDMGPQLAIRLLLPFATKSRPVAAAVSLILEHYAPSSEQYARTAMSLCMPIISEPVTLASSSLQRDVRVLVLDGCVSLLIQLYRRDENLNIESKVQLLLDGVDMEASVLPQPWLGSCYRLLQMECYSIILSLLQAMSVVIPSDGTANNDTLVSDASLMIKAKPMSEAIERHMAFSQKDVSSDSRLSSTDHVPFVAKLLIRVVTIFCLFRENSRPEERAKHIVACLMDNADAQTSVTVQLWLLRVAYFLVESQSTGVFDLHGIRVLLGRLSELSSVFENPGNSETAAQEFEDMRKGFLNALVKACYVNSNAIRDSFRFSKSQREEDRVSLYGKLGELDVETAKRCVRSMLL